MLLTIIITVALTAIVTTSLMYIKMIKPLREYAQYCELGEEISSTQLVSYKRLCADILCWVEIEARARHRPEIIEAVKQRVAERLQQ